jgi:hypothetical protein
MVSSVEDKRRRLVEALLTLLGEQPQQESLGDIHSSDVEVLAGEISRAPNPILQESQRNIDAHGGTFGRERVAHRYIASCGHVILEAAQVGGRCQMPGCRAVVCEKCLRLCRRCQKALCTRHQRIAGDEVYCSRCAEWNLAKRILGFGRRRNIVKSIQYDEDERQGSG